MQPTELTADEIAAIRARHEAGRRPFKIQKADPIDWRHVAPFEQRCYKNHGQSLERINSRSGLSACEAVALLRDEPWQSMTAYDAEVALRNLTAREDDTDIPALLSHADALAAKVARLEDPLIATSERLPEPAEYVLLYDSVEYFSIGYRYKNERQDAWALMGGGLFHLSHFPYWAPLPSPPKGAAHVAHD